MNINEAALISLVTAIANRALDHNELQMLANDLEQLKPPAIKVPEDVVCDLLKAMKDDKFIEAIKVYRALTGADLRTSKEAVERYRVILPATISSILKDNQNAGY